MLQTRCAAGQNGTTDCYCGSEPFDTCFTAGGNGVTKGEEEAGLEATDPPTIEQNFSNPSLAGGVANQLVQCLNDNGCTACFRPASGVPSLGGRGICLLGLGLALAGCLSLAGARSRLSIDSDRKAS
jgi:hypothetical protein